MRYVMIIIFIFMTLVFHQVVNAQTWHSTDQVTLAWDAPASLADGTAIPEGDEVRYRLYLADAVADPNKTNPTEVTPDSDSDGVRDPILDKSKTITLANEGRYFFGVSAVRFHDADGDGSLEQVGESAIAWSDNPEYVANDIFGVEHFISIGEPGGLRKQ